MNERLSIMSVVDMLLKKWYVLFIAAILGGVVAFLFTEFFIEPKYEAEIKLYVNASNSQKDLDEISNANITASQQLVNTYAEILKSRDFLNLISEGVEERYEADTIEKMLTMESANETEVLLVTVKHSSSEDVYKIAQLIAQNAPEYLVDMVGAGSVKVVESPIEPENPVSPNVRANTLIGVLLGIIFAGLLIVVLELLDTRIKSGEEFANNYEEPLLGEIPTLEETTHTVTTQTKESRG